MLMRYVDYIAYGKMYRHSLEVTFSILIKWLCQSIRSHNAHF